MQEPTLLHRTATTPQLQSLLNDVHTNTWFTVAGTNRIARSRTGTRPGNPLADLLFALIIDPALDSIKQDLAEADLLLTAAPGTILVGQLDDAPEPLANVAYADDVVSAAVAPINLSVEGTLQVAGKMAGVVLGRLRSRGLAVNTKMGKRKP